MWKRLSRIFGYAFTRQFGEMDDGTWAAGLRDLTEQEIATGLEACLKWEGDFPPNVGQFRALCRPAKPNRENAGMYHCPPSRQLTKQLSDEERQHGREWISKAMEAAK